MNRHADRFRELREQRKAARRRLNDAIGDEWEERTRSGKFGAESAPEKWLTPKKAQGITAVSLAIGGAIVGILQAVGAFGK